MILQKNARICFFGDSITAAGGWISEITDYLIENHFDQKIMPWNAGVPGDNATNALRRLYCDCIGLFPDCAVLMFGMNDIGRELYSGDDYGPEGRERKEKALSGFRSSMDEITNRLLEQGIRVILCTPTRYDDRQECEEKNLVHCNEGLGACAEIVRNLAIQKDLQLVDFYAAFETEAEAHPASVLINPDRVHPNADGQHFMAQTFLKAVDLLSEGETLQAVPHEKNRQRMETESLLRDISFVQWILFSQCGSEGKESEEKRAKAARDARKDKNPFIGHAVELYEHHRNNLDLLRGKLIEQTLRLYDPES